MHSSKCPSFRIPTPICQIAKPKFAKPLLLVQHDRKLKGIIVFI